MSITQEKRDEAPIIKIETALCKAEISVLGGQIISWAPKGFDEMLYLSPKATFKVGKAIRGGAPVCWPWFADAGTPKHGFARDRIWKIEKTEILENGFAHIVLSIEGKEFDGISGEIDTLVGDKLTQTLKTKNGSKKLEMSMAIHNYWSVSDVTKVKVYGLEDTKFTEKAKGTKEHSEKPLMIDGPIDRVYHETEGKIVVEDPGFGRKLQLERTGSKSVIVWNCWEDAKKLSDMPDEDFMKYLCVETGNALSETIHMEPHEENTVSYTVSVSKL